MLSGYLHNANKHGGLQQSLRAFAAGLTCWQTVMWLHAWTAVGRPEWNVVRRAHLVHVLHDVAPRRLQVRDEGHLVRHALEVVDREVDARLPGCTGMCGI